MSKKINLPCNGDGGNNTIKAESDTIKFATSGNCQFTSFNFQGGTTEPYYPPGFSNKSPTNGQGAEVSYSYDGTAIPAAGYSFEYTTSSSPKAGNGTGIIKNG
jgi:hypothetical protein